MQRLLSNPGKPRLAFWLGLFVLCAAVLSGALKSTNSTDAAEVSAVNARAVASRDSEHDHDADLGAAEDPYRGATGSQELQVTASTEAGAAGRGIAPAVGVETYKTSRGLVCLVAGPTRNGKVGRIGRTGNFIPLDAGDAPGSCGDFKQNLIDLGGIALAHVSPSEVDATTSQAIIYGLVAQRGTTVRVTWPDGRVAMADLSVTESETEGQGAAGTFVAAGSSGQLTYGAKVELLRSDGSLIHAFDF